MGGSKDNYCTECNSRLTLALCAALCALQDMKPARLIYDGMRSDDCFVRVAARIARVTLAHAMHWRDVGDRRTMRQCARECANHIKALRKQPRPAMTSSLMPVEKPKRLVRGMTAMRRQHAAVMRDWRDSQRMLPATKSKSCDNCAAQEGRHYCLLHSMQVKNMDLHRCREWRHENGGSQTRGEANH